MQRLYQNLSFIYHFIENVDFGDNDETPVEGEDVNTKTGTEVGEDDVNTRFFNVDLNTFAGQVC